MNTNTLIPGSTRNLNLVLVRTRTKGEYTEGYLSIDGVRICSTLENANAQVPAGNYPIRLTGRFIPIEEANRRPSTTVVEKVKVGPTKHRK